jgi:hypothetical protein
MVYLLLSFALAALFGIAAGSLYGWDALVDQPWVDHVFWALLLAGFAFAAIDNLRGAWCRLCGRVAGTLPFCRRGPCGRPTA